MNAKYNKKNVIFTTVFILIVKIVPGGFYGWVVVPSCQKKMAREQVVDSEILCVAPYQLSDICPHRPTKSVQMVSIVHDNVTVFQKHFSPKIAYGNPGDTAFNFFLLVFRHFFNGRRGQRIGDNYAAVSAREIFISTIQYRNVRL